MEHYLNGLLAPFCSALKVIKFLFAACKKGLDTAQKIPKIDKNKGVMRVVVEYLPSACKRVLIAFRAFYNR
jgi:hypothetical protein